MRVHFLSISLSIPLFAVVAQTHTGTLFNFAPTLGACGFTNTSSQFVASVSAHTFNTFPGADANPNKNPICKHSLNVSHNGVSLTVPIVDFCESCPDLNVGLSRVAFKLFAPLSDGVVPGVVWEVV